MLKIEFSFPDQKSVPKDKNKFTKTDKEYIAHDHSLQLTIVEVDHEVPKVHIAPQIVIICQADAPGIIGYILFQYKIRR